jgi:hypothetical protein
MLVYPDLDTFRQFYSEYTSRIIEDGDAVMLLPFYETTDSVRWNLERVGGINVSELERRGTLLILDSMSAYFSDRIGLPELAGRFMQNSVKSGKNGVSTIADLGCFSLYRTDEDIVKWEQLYGPTVPSESKIRGICCYHSKQWSGLAESHRKSILDQHFALFELKGSE